MIPRKVYDTVRFASNVCHGAELKKGNKTFSLKRGINGVNATLFIRGESSQQERLEGRGFITSVTTKYVAQFSGNEGDLLAWKQIKLNEIPESQEEEWKCWDEY